MHTITFTCEVLTPLFLNGADGKTPELRAPSIKGALRFWWRALHGHLPLKAIPGLSTGLKSLETQIFGGSGDQVQRSKVLVQVLEVSKAYSDECELVPHKPFMRAKALPRRLRFDVRLTLKGDVRDEQGQLRFGKEHLQALFMLTCYLGGFGKRVRRGMGSVDITAIDGKTDAVPPKIDLPFLFSLIQKFSPHYRLDSDKIVFAHPGKSPAYGYVVEIQLGKPYPDPNKLLYAVSSATHRVKQRYGPEYDPSMGHASRGRYASPVYVSVVRGSARPVVTTLNLAPDRDTHRASLLVQREFKGQIL